jgi:hypothetical protein
LLYREKLFTLLQIFSQNKDDFILLLVLIVLLFRRSKRQRERLARETQLNDLRVSQMRDLGRIDEAQEF